MSLQKKSISLFHSLQSWLHTFSQPCYASESDNMHTTRSCGRPMASGQDSMTKGQRPKTGHVLPPCPLSTEPVSMGVQGLFIEITRPPEPPSAAFSLQPASQSLRSAERGSRHRSVEIVYFLNSKAHNCSNFNYSGIRICLTISTLHMVFFSFSLPPKKKKLFLKQWYVLQLMTS